MTAPATTVSGTTTLGLGAPTVTVTGTVTNLDATTTNLGGTTHVVGFAATKVLCVNASGNIAVCTSVVSGTGTCTCP
jgi:hypothetical protein